MCLQVDGADLLVEAVKQATQHIRHPSAHSNPTLSKSQSKCFDSDTSGSDSDSDNAPLAALVPPRRPGSALSQVSNTSSRTRGPAVRGVTKPLIDINEISNKSPSAGPQRVDDDGFTKGGLLASRLSPSEGPGSSVETPMSGRLAPNPSSGSIGLSGVTSGATPNLTSFVPPSSSTKEVDVRPISTLNWRQTQPVQQYDVGKEKENNSERGRDKLTERLAKLAKGKDSIDAGTNSGRMMSSTSPPFQHHAGPGSLSKHSVPKLSVSPPEKPSPPDNDLICGVDDSILHLILNMGDSDVSLAPALTVTSAQVHEEADITSESESDEYGEPERKKSIKEKGKEMDRIAPIPIKQREPPSSFSVMSRPPMNRHPKDERRSTLIAPSSNTNAITKAKPILDTSDERSLMNSDIPSTVLNLKSNSNLVSSSTTSSFDTTRKRSSTLIPSSSTSIPATSSLSSSTFGASTSSFTKPNVSSGRGPNVASSVNTSNTGASGPKPNSVHTDGTSKTVASGGDGVNVKAIDSAHTSRQRSSTMVTMVPSSVSSQNKNSSRVPVASIVPAKPFAMRRDSPASSTGDSSSGRAPLTPRDGSDLGSKTVSSNRKDEWSSGVSGLSVASTKGAMRPRGANGPNKHMQRRSVSFNDDVEDEKNDKEGKIDAETRRKERRRGEAKAAIEVRTLQFH